MESKYSVINLVINARIVDLVVDKFKLDEIKKKVDSLCESYMREAPPMEAIEYVLKCLEQEYGLETIQRVYQIEKIKRTAIL